MRFCSFYHGTAYFVSDLQGRKNHGQDLFLQTNDFLQLFELIIVPYLILKVFCLLDYTLRASKVKQNVINYNNSFISGRRTIPKQSMS